MSLVLKIVKFKNNTFGVEGTSTDNFNTKGFLPADSTGGHPLALYNDPMLIDQYCQFATLDFAKQVRDDKVKLITATSVGEYINE